MPQFNSDPEAFRGEIREWLQQNCPAPLLVPRIGDLQIVWGGAKFVFKNPHQKEWLARAAEAGLTAPEWPREFGGGGLSRAQAKVLSQEMRNLKIPPPLIGFGLTMIGPTLLQYGNEEQKRQHLPGICQGQVRWCQGYSEPGAGSDLASLQCRAETSGNDYIVSGTKIWTTNADEADWIFALVRTDPQAKKQEGISFLLVDMATPGVSVSPIKLISGSSPFCETHFENVRVPRANVVGKVNGGWTVAKALLNHERSMIADTFGVGGGLPRRSMAEFARDYLPCDEDGMIEDPVMCDRIARFEMDARAFGLTLQRSRDAARAGQQPGPESSMFKVYGTELNQRRHELMLRIAGPQALGWQGPGFSSEELSLTRAWLRSRGNSIEGGTSEVQRNVIAKRVLALPD